MSVMQSEWVPDAAEFAPPLAPLAMPVQVLEAQPHAGAARLAWRALVGARARSAD